MKNQIVDLLIQLQLSTKDSFRTFHPKTRDIKNFRVLKCSRSGVIVLEEFVSDEAYYKENIHYSKEKKGEVALIDETIKTEPLEDDNRRFESYKDLIHGSDILDFGCGTGGFLRLSQQMSKSSVGIELNESNRKNINDQGILCLGSHAELPANCSFDLITLNHVFEHLIDPIGVLVGLQKYLKDDGTIIIEVPHAKDLLLETFNLNSFKDFTFWSEHLILHTEESLTAFARESSLVVKTIKGFQRYPISNHFNWLLNGKPSGHSKYPHLNDLDFHKIYEKFLSNLNQTDTLIGYFGKESLSSRTM